MILHDLAVIGSDGGLFEQFDMAVVHDGVGARHFMEPVF